MNFASGSMRKTTALAGFALFALATCAMAAGNLDVILVKGSNEGTSDASLKPYLTFLARSGFKAYQVVAKRTTAMETGAVTLAEGFKVTLSEVKGNRVPVSIYQGGAEKIRTTVNFAPGRPVVLGIFEGKDGAKMIIVLVLQE